MEDTMKIIRTFFTITCGIFVTLIFCLLALVARLIFIPTATVRKLAPLWAKLILQISGVTLTVEGRENIIKDAPQLFVANHQGIYDIPALLTAIPVDFLWVAKKELFFIPLFGQALKIGGYIPIDRRNYLRALQGLKRAASQLQKGISLVSFPEGTRSEDGKLLPFKKGMFYLAIETGMPILPTTIIGSNLVLPKGSLKITPGKITIIFDRAIPTKETTVDGCDELLIRVRNIIASHLTKQSKEEFL